MAEADGNVISFLNINQTDIWTLLEREKSWNQQSN